MYFIQHLHKGREVSTQGQRGINPRVNPWIDIPINVSICIDLSFNKGMQALAEFAFEKTTIFVKHYLVNVILRFLKSENSGRRMFFLLFILPIRLTLFISFFVYGLE